MGQLRLFEKNKMLRGLHPNVTIISNFPPVISAKAEIQKCKSRDGVRFIDSSAEAGVTKERGLELQQKPDDYE